MNFPFTAVLRHGFWLLLLCLCRFFVDFDGTADPVITDKPDSLKTFPSNSRVTFLSLTSLQCFIVNSNKLKQKKFLLELFIEFFSLFLDLLFQNKDIKQIIPELYFRCGRVCHPGQNSLPTANVID